MFLRDFLHTFPFLTLVFFSPHLLRINVEAWASEGGDTQWASSTWHELRLLPRRPPQHSGITRRSGRRFSWLSRYRFGGKKKDVTRHFSTTPPSSSSSSSLLGMHVLYFVFPLAVLFLATCARGPHGLAYARAMGVVGGEG